MLKLSRRVLTLLFGLLIVALPLGPTQAQTAIEQRITNVSLPKGTGPFPAVILMHWTAGPGSPEKKWSKLLTDNGIAAVTLKSYNKASGSTAALEAQVPERIGHLQQAFAHVKAQGWSNGKISVLGRSHGGWAVVDALQAGALRSGLYRAVAVAPRCDGKRGATTRFASKTPLLIVIGSSDRAEYYKPCVEYGQRLDGKRQQVQAYKSGHSVDLDSREATRAILTFLR